MTLTSTLTPKDETKPDLPKPKKKSKKAITQKTACVIVDDVSLVPVPVPPTQPQNLFRSPSGA